MFDTVRKSIRLNVCLSLMLVFSLSCPLLVKAQTQAFSIADVFYDTLEEAVENADAHALIKLQKDWSIQNSVSIPGSKHLTLDLNDFTLTSEIDEASGVLFNVSGEGSFTIEKGKLVGADLDGDGQTGGAITVQNTDFTAENITATNFHKTGEGGAIYGKTKNFTINKCNFNNNSARENGGAVRINANFPNANVIISNSIIENNLVTAESYAFGGGIMYYGQGKLNILNNKASNNKARVTGLTYDFYWSQGGGLYISSDFTDGPLHVTLEENTISNNSAQLFGGGIYFSLEKDKGDQIDLISGLFENNHSDFAGGAIDYSLHGQPVLHIENAVITGNEAVTGAGIWACPTSVVDSHSTFGAVISDNTLLDPITPPGSRTSGRNPLSSGTDVRFEGSDTSFKDYLSHNNPAIHKMTLVRRTFLGDWADWYKDNMEDLYEQGDLPMSPEEYTERSTTLGAKSILPEDALSRALDASNLIFCNNTAVRGGAISTNSDIQIGRPGDKSLQVKKVWLDDKGQTLDKNIPEAVEVTLVQKTSNGDSKDLETVELSEANAWSWTFEQLPASAIIKDETVLYDYEVREDSELTGYRSEQSVNMVDEKTMQVEIKNIRKPEETTTTVTTPSSSDETTTTTTATTTTTTTTTGTTTGQTTQTKHTTTQFTHGTTAPTSSEHETPAAGDSNNNFIVSTLCLTLATCLLWGKAKNNKRNKNAHRK